MDVEFGWQARGPGHATRIFCWHDHDVWSLGTDPEACSHQGILDILLLTLPALHQQKKKKTMGRADSCASLGQARRFANRRR